MLAATVLTITAHALPLNMGVSTGFSAGRSFIAVSETSDYPDTNAKIKPSNDTVHKAYGPSFIRA